MSDIFADLDSLCSAVVFAYIRTYSTSAKTSQLHIPLSNLPRADLSLRPELQPVLATAQLSPSDLITLSDLPSSPQHKFSLRPQDTRWLLVDHNALQAELGFLYASHVVGCIDHHDDEKKVPQESEPRIITKSGSCASLVVQYCREAWDSMAPKSAKDETTNWDAELAGLALAPILIDTTNLTSSSKVMPVDIEAVDYLEAKIKEVKGSSYNRDQYFKQISDAKQEIGRLSLSDIMRKDYKEWNEAGSNLGISSVVKNIDFLAEKAGSDQAFLDTVRQFGEKRKLSIVCIMTTFTKDGKFGRELLVWGLDKAGAKTAQKFEKNAKDSLGLQSWKDGKLDEVDQSGEWRRCWVQERVENSRKQVQPMMIKSMI